MKWLLILVFTLVFYLFIPRYDLAEVIPSFQQDRQLEPVEANFFSRERCRTRARELKLEEYVCIKTHSWDGVFSNYRKYNYEPARADSRD